MIIKRNILYGISIPFIVQLLCIFYWIAGHKWNSLLYNFYYTFTHYLLFASFTMTIIKKSYSKSVVKFHKFSMFPFIGINLIYTILRFWGFKFTSLIQPFFGKKILSNSINYYIWSGIFIIFLILGTYWWMRAKRDDYLYLNN